MLNNISSMICCICTAADEAIRDLRTLISSVIYMGLPIKTLCRFPNIILYFPPIATGITGKLFSSASKANPGWNGFITPFFDVEPSGKMQIEYPSFIFSVAEINQFASGLNLSIGIERYKSRKKVKCFLSYQSLATTV